MERGKWMSLVMVLSILALTLTVSAPAQAADPIKLNYSSFFPAPAQQTVIIQEWAAEVEKRTNGAVKITVFPGGTLTPADKCYDGVVKGLSDLGQSCPAYTRGKFPLTEVTDLPLGMKSGLEATKLINAYLKKFQPKEFGEVKIMYFHGHGPGILHTKKPVSNLDELKGMKIRCTGLATKIVSALGATPVSMPMGETYDSISKGVVDGSMAPFEALKTWKWGEVVKYTTLDYGSSYSTAFFVVMNKDKWNSLPKDVQATIEKVNEEWIEKTGKMWDEIDKSGKEFAEKLGSEVISLSKEEDGKWAKLVRPILDEYVKNMKEKNLPGEEALKFYLDKVSKAK
jgi:TRAP-type C4-dicarboxylate transport system substrate-binding protein